MQNWKESKVEECIFDYIALHFECQTHFLKKNIKNKYRRVTYDQDILIWVLDIPWYV